MCGIAGLMYFDEREPDEATLKAMTDVIVHRGPDDFGTWSESRIGLGFRRLSIIDLAEGHQPLSNGNGNLWISFNGEIYNYKTLRNELEAKGYVFRTHSDTEVIVHMYEEYGEQCVNMLRGMFSFVIWDREKKELFGARDHFGIKPFYYYKSHEQFIFASEIKSILQVEGMQRSVSNESLFQYLTFQYVPEPNTMFADIHKMPPAHCVKITADGNMTMKQYWDPMFAPEDRSFDYYVEEIRAKLNESVILHMQSDVERGCFLSSGIDSTAIAAHMRAIEPIRTFSVGFEGANNETTIAAETAQALGTEHYSRIITQEDYFKSLAAAIWHQDEPVADPSAIALYHVAKLAREHVTVVLSGEGADELFGGYRIYREPGSLRALSWMPRPLQRMVHGLAAMLPASTPGRNFVLRGTTPLEERFLGNAKIFTDDMKADVLRISQDQFGSFRSPFEIAGDFYRKTEHLDPVSRMQYIDMNLWMPGDILMKADKMTMANSLELRVPFLDKEMFELARRIPVKYRLAEGTTKYVLRQAMKGIVPDFIMNRPKLGFPVPLRDWVKGKQGDQLLEMMKSSKLQGFINADTMELMLQRHRAGQGDYARRIWTVYIFALWHSTYVEQAAGGQVLAR